MDKEECMPIFGVGPMYVIICILLTICGIALVQMGFLNVGNVGSFHILFYIFGIIFIILGIILWLFAVVFSRIDEKIKSDKLVTNGVYSIVRNPIYSAFLFICTGALLFVHNLLLLLLPLLFWFLLTIFMIFTEEKWLKKKFGVEYEEYSKHVNRVIPFFRKKRAREGEIEVENGY